MANRPMSNKQHLVVAISSRALFDLEDSHKIYEEEGVDAYSAFQLAHENEVLNPGVAFALVQKLLALNTTEDLYVEVILLSRNSSDTGLRVFNSIQHYGLTITRSAFTNGAPPYRYVEPFNAQLFLSADSVDVRSALEAGYAAAQILPLTSDKKLGEGNDELRIAFDGDAVLFSDDAERIYKEHGLQAFTESEQAAAHNPLPDGPFKAFLAAIHRIQSNFSLADCPVKTALVTARSAPAHERVIRTFRSWNIRIDEALFLGGMEKGPFLKAFGADIFFDDQRTHCDSASQHVATGHVLHGVANSN